jgi:hypothetical protein
MPTVQKSGATKRKAIKTAENATTALAPNRSKGLILSQLNDDEIFLVSRTRICSEIVALQNNRFDALDAKRKNQIKLLSIALKDSRVKKGDSIYTKCNIPMTVERIRKWFGDNAEMTYPYFLLKDVNEYV